MCDPFARSFKKLRYRSLDWIQPKLYVWYLNIHLVTRTVNVLDIKPDHKLDKYTRKYRSIKKFMIDKEFHKINIKCYKKSSNFYVKFCKRVQYKKEMS